MTTDQQNDEINTNSENINPEQNEKSVQQQIKQPEILFSAPSPLKNNDKPTNETVNENQSEIIIPPQLDVCVKPEKKTVENGFNCVISMHDGVVLFTTNTITDSLGFPRDMWLGRSFIDFVHPKDRSTFASQITSGVATPFSETKGGFNKDVKNSLCVMLRRYRGLKTGGFGVIGKSVSYEPFNLILSFRESPEETISQSKNGSILLVIRATPIKSIYKTPDEKLSHLTPKFTTRHTASGILSHVDGAAVGALGYLPQDIIGRSIMDFYHPEELPFLKEVYETVMLKGAKTGTSFCSQPYRFLVQNGNYIKMQTEWSSFVNPWSRKLEFVIGHHRVLKGPSNPNIFSKFLFSSLQFSNDLLIESKQIKDLIIRLLAEPVSRSHDTVREQVSKRCQALASFMENLMDEVTNSDLKLDLPQESELTISERDSVMLGEISPHHDYCDSKSSSETPPSYNQLNYNENLQRFFDSKPVTNEVGKSMTIETINDETTRNNSLSPVQYYNESGTGSAGDLSSGSHVKLSSITQTSHSGTGTLSEINQTPCITEDLINRHNDDMEKNMLKKHRELRNGYRNSEKNKKVLEKIPTEHEHGVKRSGSHSWEEEAYKSTKYQHHTENPSTNSNIANQTIGQWPISATNGTTTTTTTPQFSNPTNIFPTLYYIPTTDRGINNQSENITTNRPIAVQYVTGIMYPHQSCVMYPMQPMMYQPIPFQPNPPARDITIAEIKTQVQRPVSETTSIKVEPGSNMGSVVYSETSKRIESTSREMLGQMGRLENTCNKSDDVSDDNMDQSSFSSFYSSFLKTDCSTIDDDMGSCRKSDNEFKYNRTRKTWRREPPWLDNVNVTADLVYRYQMKTRDVNEVLKSDLKALKLINQVIFFI